MPAKVAGVGVAGYVAVTSLQSIQFTSTTPAEQAQSRINRARDGFIAEGRMPQDARFDDSALVQNALGFAQEFDTHVIVSNNHDTFGMRHGLYNWWLERQTGDNPIGVPRGVRECADGGRLWESDAGNFVKESSVGEIALITVPQIQRTQIQGTPGVCL